MNDSSVRRLFDGVRALDRRIWILAAARSINTIGFSIVMPFMAMYLVEQRGATGTEYGSIYLVSGIIGSIVQALAGEASDRLGRRRVMVVALATRAANMLVLGTAVSREAPVWVLMALIVLNGSLRSIFDPAASAAVTDLAGPKQRVAAFGLQRIGINVGWALGPALGGAFAIGSYGSLFFFAAPLTAIAAAAVWRVRLDAPAVREPPPPRRPLKVLLEENATFAGYLVLVLIGGIMTSQVYATFSVYSRVELGLDREQIGLLYTVNGLLVVLLQAPAVALIHAIGLGRTLVIGPLLYALAYAAFGQVSSFPALAGAMAVLTMGEILFSPALSDMAAVLGDPRRLGRAFGLFGLMQSLGISLGPIAGGAVFDALRHDHQRMWGVMAVGSLVVAAGYGAFLVARPKTVEAS